MVIDETKWHDLESGAARLATGPDGVAALDELWSAAVVELRTLHRDLALWEREPARFAPTVSALDRLLRVLRAQLRPGRDLSTGGWRATVESGRDDLDRATLQFMLQRPASASGVASTLVVLVAEVALAALGRADDPRWPLPFEMLALEDVDRLGTSVIRSIERDEGDGAFVGLLTLRDGKATGNPTDFGVRLGAFGSPEWIGGPAARPALEASARAAAAAASLVEEMRAAEAARAALEAPAVPAPSRSASARRERPDVAGERAAARPTPDSRSRRAARGAASAEPRAEGPVARPSACASCGAALPAGAGFCSGCGAPVRKTAPASARPRSTAPAPPVELRCGGCGAKLGPGARFCPKCGVAVPSVPTPPAAASPARETPRVSAPPRCARCGTVCQPGAQFCRACGGPLSSGSSAGREAPAAAPRCARCGGELSVGARFCRHCGAVTGGGP